MQPKKAQTRVVIVDDHPLVRQGIATLLGAEEDFVVSGETEDLKTTLNLLKSTEIDLLILDIGLKDTDGLVALKEIKAQHPDLKILVFSGQEESVYAARLIRAGASGYLMKGEPHSSLLAALRKVANGDLYFSPQLEAELLKRLVSGDESPLKSPVELLTDRELEVFMLFGQGLATREVSEKLHLSIKTVDAHRSRIKEKMGLKNVSEFVHRAVEWVRKGTKE